MTITPTRPTLSAGVASSSPATAPAPAGADPRVVAWVDSIAQL
ncbi:MAG: hypothetical protein JWO18_2364, partial [Microbacteriaceae bacterium]|nr:hypothetical protein [Microbacteriaceae bacterium]